MTVSPSEIYAIELLLFSALALGIVCLPLRWSLLCLLLAGCVEVIPPGFVAASSISWENAVGRAILPVVLLLRLTHFHLPKIKWGFPSKTWVALILYAAVSILWSPYKLSGLKMIAYLTSWFVLYLVFHLAWRRGLLDQSMFMGALWGSLALACLQTYVMGNPLYGIEANISEFASPQFAPFTGPQYFGPFLACLLALLLFSMERKPLRSASIAVCLVALVLVGSRYSLIEAGVVLFVWFLISPGAAHKTTHVRMTRAFGALLLAVAVFFALRPALAWVMPNSRVNQILELGSQPDVAEAGTFGWRILLYERVIAELSSRPLTALTFGSGTSSAAQVATQGQQDRDIGVDPNRTIHDEFLRAEYEWGFIGLGLGVCLLVYTAARLWTRAIKLHSVPAYAALAIMPGILLALLVENPLAGPGTAESFGYLLVLTYAFATSRESIAARLSNL